MCLLKFSFLFFVLFQPQPVVLPSLLGVPAAAAAVPGGQQQPAGLPPGGDRPDELPDAAGRLLQRDRPPAAADRRLQQPAVAGPAEEPPARSTCRSDLSPAVVARSQRQPSVDPPGRAAVHGDSGGPTSARQPSHMSTC